MFRLQCSWNVQVKMFSHVSVSSTLKRFRFSIESFKHYLAFREPLFRELRYLEFFVIKIGIIESLYINWFRFLKSFNELWVYGMADDANNKIDSAESSMVQSRPMTFWIGSLLLLEYSRCLSKILFNLTFISFGDFRNQKKFLYDPILWFKITKK